MGSALLCCPPEGSVPAQPCEIDLPISQENS
jgi:hypothetical protein